MKKFQNEIISKRLTIIDCSNDVPKEKLKVEHRGFGQILVTEEDSETDFKENLSSIFKHITEITFLIPTVFNDLFPCEQDTTINGTKLLQFYGTRDCFCQKQTICKPEIHMNPRYVVAQKKKFHQSV